MAAAHQHIAAASLLGRMLFGITETTLGPVSDDEPTLSASEITGSDDGVVSATIHLPSGDAYRVSVEWLSEESP